MKKGLCRYFGLAVYFLKSDVLNSRATKIYSELLASDTKLVTHEGVLFEIGNALSSSKSRHIVIKLKESKDWGIIDCISFVLMKRANISEALITDRHFEQAGFTKLL